MLSVGLKMRKDPLYRNSFYLMATAIARAGFGFFFWIIAAALYLMEDIGVATAVISALNIIAALSRFGIDQSLTREIPNSDRSRLIYTSTIVTTIAAVMMAIVLVIFVDSIIPELTIIRQFFIVFISFVAVFSIFCVYNTAFTALRRSDIVFLQSLIGGSRILLLFPLVLFGAIGIVMTEFASYILLVIISVIILWRWKIPLISKFDGHFLRRTMSFSAGNYVASFMLTIPSQIISLIIIAVLGADETAAFYMGFMVFQLVLGIPTAISTSMFVEGSHGVDLKGAFNKANRLSIGLLVPAVILVYLLGEWLLGFIGSGYATGGGDLLRVIALSSFFVAIYFNYMSLFKVTKHMRYLVILSSLLFVLIVATSYIFLSTYGVVGIGYSWVLSHAIVVIVGYPWIRRALSTQETDRVVPAAQP